MEKNALRFEFFVWKWSQIAAQEKFIFLLILPYKTWWKSRFPMDQRPLGKGYIANFGISLDVVEFMRFGLFFRSSKKFCVSGILGQPHCGIGATICIGREMLCLPYAQFFDRKSYLKLLGRGGAIKLWEEKDD